MICPACGGNGKVSALILRNDRVAVGIDCDLCDKTGVLDEKKLEWIRLGNQYRNARIASGQTLREFSIKNNLDCGIVSKAERGVIDPSILEVKK